MNTPLRRCFTVVVLIAVATSLHASSTVRLSLKQQVDQAIAICRGTVVEVASFRDPATQAIRTRTLVLVDEALKGTFPPVVRLIHEGGGLPDEGSGDGFAPQFRPGERRLLFLARRADGSLEAADGQAGARLLGGSFGGEDSLVAAVRASDGQRGKGNAADVTDQAEVWLGEVPDVPVQALDATGLLVAGNGVPSRYLAPDRGEAVEYLVDADTLPTGLTLNQCLGAVTNAFAAWSAVTGINFKYGGLQSFGQTAANVAINDQRIRIQLHDAHNFITSDSTLGRGGRNFAISGAFPTGGMGGLVAGQEFFPNNYGYVVMNHRPASMQNILTYEEVLCHEIGHALGMAHSSENPAEPAGTLREAMMFYLVHADGRGATLGTYDPPIIQKAQPPASTPPYGYDRVMDIVTASPQPNVAGVNSVQVAGYDLQGTSLTVTLTNASNLNGAFALQGSLLKYTANAAFSDSGRFDPAGNSFRDVVFLRYSDGVNGSPWLRVRVLSYNFDNRPVGVSDGLPNSWATTHFGSTTPSAASLTRAQDDYDDDGRTNLEEWLAGTAPNASGSVLKLDPFDGGSVNFTARPYEVYELIQSTDLPTWTRVVNPLLPTTTTGAFTGVGAASGRKFFQVRRVP